MVGWHHRLNGHDFEQTPGGSEGRGSLACCSPWVRRVCIPAGRSMPSARSAVPLTCLEEMLTRTSFQRNLRNLFRFPRLPLCNE